MPTRASTARANQEKENLNAGNVRQEPGVFISPLEMILESQKRRI